MSYTDQELEYANQNKATSNKYLADIETWCESDLPYYKKKVKDRIASGYIMVIGGAAVAYGIYIAIMAIGMMVSGKFFDFLSAYPMAQWGCVALTAIIVIPIIRLIAKKTVVKFVDSCHGEIGHEGYPFVKKVKAHIIISLILGLVVAAVLIVLFGKNASVVGDVAVLNNFMFLPALVAPFAYFWGTIAGLGDLTVCPICGRYNTVYKVKLGQDFGTRKDGHHKEYDYETERVGTKTTTTYWSDGSTSTNSEGIYESVRYVNEYDDFSSLSKYAYFCKECSYAEETIEEKQWKTLQAKYRG